MAARASALLLLGASAAMAGPVAPRQNVATVTVTAVAAMPTASATSAWDAGAVHDFTIHASCNATQRTMIRKGLDEAMTLVGHARDHILRYGSSSEIYTKYFGDAPTGEPIGWFTKMADGDKSDILFRCDNIDGNCGQEGWAGYWRGSNASSETVICDLSYELRRPLSAMCMFGYDVANGATNNFWASDLVHRILHLPSVGEGVVEHYIDEEEEKYPGVMDLAENNSTWAGRNSDTLQYFALEAYAHDIAVPGIGCPGTYTPLEESSTVDATSSAASAMSSTVVDTSSAAAVTSASAAPAEASASATLTADAGPVEACEPHGDHWHCPPGVPEPTSPPA
ncbi:zincin [Decorospora gaudefroyi]|uniref:Zincin n=1 Tax=Decorospora gaudefroyi TaxID=184978 RepID=A0A6A5KLB5_9PLEO|nr:zincin [Decorospora gaudefroyi]